MHPYTDDTFESIWAFECTDGNTYIVAHNKTLDTYNMYEITDIKEVAYKNEVVKKDFQKLNGRFKDTYGSYFVVVRDNVIHCETGPAINLPYGLNNFRPKQDITHYLIHGKIFSQYSWLTWVKGSSSWSQAMANILGSKE